MAWHTRLRKHVVIKVVKDCFTEVIGVHRNEVEALKTIKSMYIPQVYDFFIENGHSFTVIEYIEGESFDKLLKSGQRFTEEQIIKWYGQLISALGVIHKHDICHRDIKPANIILAKTGDINLIDFNSAFVSSNNTGLINRSMGYASPEQYEYFKLCRNAFSDDGKAHNKSYETTLLISGCKTEAISGGCISEYGKTHYINWKLSDIYSLGATMYHLLIGKRPPVRAEEVAKISKTNGYSKEILAIIEKSMRSDPSERYATADELKEILLLL